MKFCQICGRPLNDGEVCNCQAQQQAAPQQPQYQQPQQAPYQQAPYQQSPYQQAPQAGRPAPGGESAFVKALKNIPVAAKSYFKGSDKVIGTAKAKKDILLPALYVAIFFLANLILSICFFARATSTSYYKGFGILQGVFATYKNYFNFGYVLLSALIMTVIVCGCYVLVRFLAMVIFAKKAPGTAIVEAFIEFGFHMIPVSCLVLLAALLGLATAWLVAPLIGLAGSYLVVMYIMSTLEDAKNYQNKLVVTIVMVASVMVAVAVVFWMLHLMCRMNYEYIPKSTNPYSDFDLDDLADLAQQYGGN